MSSFNDSDQIKELDEISRKADSLASTTFDKAEHESKSRLEITKLFLKWYFCLICGSFLFCILYNLMAAMLNFYFNTNNPIKHVDVSNTVSIVTTTLSSGMGFVIGYYFKNKE